MDRDGAKDGGSRTERGAEQNALLAPSVVLPKGGGAIKGIGEKFSVNPANGTASLEVPIFCTPGRSGFYPQLSLSYDSGAGNGQFGFGWRLSIPSVTRKTDKGLPRYFDEEESDVFILSGAEDLVPTQTQSAVGQASSSPGDGLWAKDDYSTTLNGQSYWVRRYRPRIEGLFARIERWVNASSGEAFWKSVSKDNVTSLYGSDASRRIADPDDPSRVFSWLLSLTYDDRGNVAVYRYKAEDGANVPSAAHEANRSITANRYLKRIQYGNRTPYAPNANADPPSDWCFELVFDYGEHEPTSATPAEATPWRCRPDPFSSYRSCFEVRTYRLCSRVLMFHHFEGALGVKDCLVRSTDLSFSCDEAPPDPLSPIYSFLTAATQTGYVLQSDGSYESRSMPPLEFRYTEARLDPTLHEAEPDSLENLPIGVDGARYQWVDLDSEGSPGILTEQSGTWFYKRNLSSLAPTGGRASARFEAVERVATIPFGADTDRGAQALMDLAGDGQLCVVQFRRPVAGYYERDEDRQWRRFAPFMFSPNIDWRDPNLRTVDLDGDGFADVLITEHEVFTWYPSWARAGFGAAQTVRKPFDEDCGPAVIFADGTQSIYLADMSGDGLKDLARIRNGEVCYWPNIGYGRFGAKITMDAAPCFDEPDLFDQKRVRLADVDGSGSTDIIYLGHSTVRVWLNQSGNGWSARQDIDAFPATDSLDAVSAVDLLGNGTTCLVWSSPLPGDVARPLRYIDLMGGGKPHLMVTVCNNLGAETRVCYAPSTKFYLADRAAGRPWVTRLSFPVQVVERVETFDWISRNRLASRYTYHHGYFDGLEREFRGFGRVDQLDTDELGALEASGEFPAASNIDAASYVPPVLTKTWYHTGAYPMGRRVSRVYDHEYYAESDGTAGACALSQAQIEAMRLPDTVLPPGLSAGEIHEAIRSLKGSVLRQELYALDGTDAAGRPYSVSEKNYTIRCLQPFAGNRHAVFFTHERETIDFHYERALYNVGQAVDRADPRVSHALILAVDDYGNALQSVAVGYGRRYPDLDPLVTTNDQTNTRITLTINSYTTPIGASDAYRTPLIAEAKTYELLNLAPIADLSDVTNLFTFEEMTAALSRATNIPYEGIYGSEATGDQPYRRILADQRTLYWQDGLTGPAALGTMGTQALLCETYKQALTPGLVTQVYQGPLQGQPQSLAPAPTGDVLFATSGASGTPLSQAGYADLDGDGVAWVPSGQIVYSTPFFLQCQFVDPFGNTTLVSYDGDNLLLVQTQDPVGNVVTVANDYRVMQPKLITDPNGNQTAADFDALGFVARTAVMGKPGENVGDSLPVSPPDLVESVIDAFAATPVTTAAALLGTATTRFVYDLSIFQTSRGDNPTNPTQWAPAFAATIARETHVSDVGSGPPSRLQIGFSFSDGFGREIQQKSLAASDPATPDSPRWLGSGWTVFNNKGKPVRKFEPFFTATNHFEFASATGVSPIVFYDPVGRVVATIHPDHSWEKVVFDPWGQQSWDGADTALVPDPSQDADVGAYFQRLPQADYLPVWSGLYPGGPSLAPAAGTPSLAFFDTLGRTFLTVADNGLGGADGSTQQYATYTELDIQGYQRSVTDALGRKVMVYDYDMLGSRLHSNSVDAGERWMLNDVTGKPMLGWNSNGNATRRTYDPDHRPLGLYVQPLGGSEILAESLVYGEAPVGATATQIAASAAANLNGKLYQSFDAAGVVTNSAYDFKGNLLTSSRQIFKDAYAQAIDWSMNPIPHGDIFTANKTYDALNRPVTIAAPDGSVQSPVYNQTKLLTALSATIRSATTSTVFIVNIDYNARGQRLNINYGNNASTTYAYDPNTFRLTELKTTRPSATLAGGTDLLQDLIYSYDPVGNITQIQDAAQSTIYFANQAVPAVATYTYDPIYRLISATGREHIGLAAQPWTTWDDSARMGNPIPNLNDAQTVQNYTETYVYDQVGNFQSFNHVPQGNAAGSWTRTYNYDEPNLPPKTNRLTSTVVSSTTETYSYLHDYDGNMTQMPHLPQMGWTFKDELQSTQQQVVSNGSTSTTYYVYDTAGQRVRKVTMAASGTKKCERIYLAGYEVFREYDARENATFERRTLHVMDDKQRVALVETMSSPQNPPSSPPASPSPVLRFQFGNHLGSALLELDGSSAAIISYEEYYPYGSTSYQAVSAVEVSAKRYRYTGKERDEESGFYYHGARYYAPWFGRWVSCDPAGNIDGPNRYAYVRLMPTVNSDKTGLATDPPEDTDRPRNSSPLGESDIYRRLKSKPNFTREHGIATAKIKHTLSQKHGEQTVSKVMSRVRQNMQTVQNENIVAAPKTVRDNIVSAEYRVDTKAGRQTDVADLFLRSRKDWVEAAQEGGRPLSKADVARIDSIMRQQMITAVRIDVALDQQRSGRILPNVLAHELNPTGGGSPKTSAFGENPVNIVSFTNRAPTEQQGLAGTKGLVPEVGAAFEGAGKLATAAKVLGATGEVLGSVLATVGVAGGLSQIKTGVNDISAGNLAKGAEQVGEGALDVFMNLSKSALSSTLLSLGFAGYFAQNVILPDHVY